MRSSGWYQPEQKKDYFWLIFLLIVTSTLISLSGLAYFLGRGQEREVWNVGVHSETIPVVCSCSAHCEHTITVTAPCHIDKIVQDGLEREGR